MQHLHVFCLVFVSSCICMHINDKRVEKLATSDLNRYRRQTTTKENITIEVLFVVDYAVYSRFLDIFDGNETETHIEMEIYYARVFDGLNRRYMGISSPEVKFVLTYSDLNISKTAQSSIWTTPLKQKPEAGSSREMVDTASVLDRFLNWINSSKDLPNFDYAILFTGYNLTYGGSSSNTGLSYPSSICKPVSLQEPMIGPVAVVEEHFDTRIISIIAQELGRSLGARKDLDGNFCLPSFLYIMTSRFQFPDVTRASNLWKFSSCSIDYFENYIDTLNSNGDNCLSNSEPSDYISDVPLFLREQSAEVLDIDDQCRYIHGSDSFLCRGIQGSDFGSICRGAYCYVPERQTCSLILPGDGTFCSNTSLCLEGVCTFSSLAPTAPSDCPFGNQPVIPNSDGCEKRIIINNRTYDCYQPTLRLVCCKSCGDLYTGIGGCEYGDRQTNCNYNSCGTYDNYTRDVRCCRTCSVTPLSNTSVLTSTVTSHTMEVELTSEATVTSDYPDIQTSHVSVSQDITILATETSHITNGGYTAEYTSPEPKQSSTTLITESNDIDTQTSPYIDITTETTPTLDTSPLTVISYSETSSSTTVYSTQEDTTDSNGDLSSTSSIVTNTVDTMPMTTLSTSTTTTGVTSSQSTTKRLTSTTIPTTSLMTTAPTPWCLSYLGNGGFNHGWLWNLWSRDRWWRMLLGLKGHWNNHFLRKRKKQLWRKQHWKRYPHYPVGFSRRLRAKTHKWYSKQERKRWKNFKKALKKKKYNLKKLKRKKSKRKMSKRRWWMFPS